MFINHVFYAAVSIAAASVLHKLYDGLGGNDIPEWFMLEDAAVIMISILLTNFALRSFLKGESAVVLALPLSGMAYFVLKTEIMRVSSSLEGIFIGSFYFAIVAAFAMTIVIQLMVVFKEIISGTKGKIMLGLSSWVLFNSAYFYLYGFKFSSTGLAVWIMEVILMVSALHLIGWGAKISRESKGLSFAPFAGSISYFFFKFMASGLLEKSFDIKPSHSPFDVMLYALAASVLFSVLYLIFMTTELKEKTAELEQSKEEKEEKIQFRHIALYSKREIDINDINERVGWIKENNETYDLELLHEITAGINRISLSIDAYNKMKSERKKDAERMIDEMIDMLQTKIEKYENIHDSMKIKEIEKHHLLMKK